jgi:hypothetical protein
MFLSFSSLALYISRLNTTVLQYILKQWNLPCGRVPPGESEDLLGVRKIKKNISFIYLKQAQPSH